MDTALNKLDPLTSNTQQMELGFYSRANNLPNWSCPEIYKEQNVAIWEGFLAVEPTQELQESQEAQK